MSNLATMIMEGSSIGGYSARLDRSYGVEDGAGMIAMESAEALKDIFEAEFYVPNTCTIAATLEGVSVEESSQAEVMEASIKGVFAKIKEFLIKLKEKVKDFLHNIKRYLQGIFMSDSKWVEKYEKEIMAIGADKLKGYKVKLYDYAKAIDDPASINVPDVEGLKKLTETLYRDQHDQAMSQATAHKELDEDSVKEEYETNYNDWASAMIGGKKFDPEDAVKEIWSYFRNGADNESDKDEVEVAGKRKEFINAIKKSTNIANKYTSVAGKIDTAYTKAIKFVNDCEKEVAGATKDETASNPSVKFDHSKAGTGMTGNISGSTTTVASNYGKLLRAYSSQLSKQQTFMNNYVSASKSALVERNKVYKSALTGVFAYARKNKSK